MVTVFLSFFLEINWLNDIIIVNTRWAQIFLVWAVALVVSVAPLFGWKDDKFTDRVNIEQQCLISQDISYQIFATCATFYVPLAVILIVYWKIFQTARRRIRKRNDNKVPVSAAAAAAAAATAATQNSAEEKKKRRWFQCGPTSSSANADDAASDAGPSGVSPKHRGVDEGQESQQEQQQQTTAFTIEIPPVIADEMEIRNGSTDSAVLNSQPNATISSGGIAVKRASTVVAPPATADNMRRKRETLEAKRERKAAKTLAIITGAFVVCWLPFFVCATLMPLFPEYANEYFDKRMLSVFLWLGYFNSTLNPIIYTIFSPEFRQAFKRLLCGKAAVQTSAYRPRKLR